jgi:hypothetical protein
LEGILSLGSEREELVLTKFSLIPDGKLMQSLKYELGTRCRIWINSEQEISYESGHLIFWDEFEGEISEDRNSFELKHTGFGETHDIILIRIEDEETINFMDQLEASIGGEYTYRIPEKTEDGWVCGNVEDCGIDKEKIVQLVQNITEGEHGDIHSVLIVKTGTLYWKNISVQPAKYLDHL